MLGRTSSVTPVYDLNSRIEDSDCMIMEERQNRTSLHKLVQEAAVTAWTSDNVAVAVSDILGPHARKEWNFPVGSSKNPFWRFTRKVTSPYEIKKMLTKTLTVTCSTGSVALVKNLLEAGADPNGESGKWGPLHSAAYSGNVEVMRILHEDHRTDINSVEGKGKTALHLAAKKGNWEVLKLLLENTKINVNATDETGCTALHIAGSSPLIGEVPADRFLQCITHLMNRSDVKLNIPDKEGLTPLGQAVTFCRKEMVQRMLQHSNGQYYNVDNFLTGCYGTTIRDAITDAYPDLVSELPKPFQEKTESPIIANRLLAYLQNGDYIAFQSLLKNQKQIFDINHWYDEPYHCTIIEIACQIKNRKEFIIALLNVGANPNTVNQLTSQSLLHLTAKSGNTEALKTLLQMKDIDINIKDSYSRTALHCLSGIQNKKHSSELQESITLLLGESSPVMDDRRKSDINAVTCNGETPLHIAARVGEKETILTLIRHGADIMHTTINIKPPITYIDPAVIESYLDECIESNEHSPMQEDYTLTLDYSFLYPEKENSANCNNKKNKKRNPEMPTLKYFSTKHHFRHLLKHPIISSFIELKWCKVRFMFYTNFLLYSIFLAVLTWHSLLPNEENESDHTRFQHKISVSILSTLLLIMIFGQLYQFLQSPKTYIRHSDNCLLWIVILMTVNVCVDKIITLIPQCTSIALLLAWSHFVSMIGRFPVLSIQLEMLNKVLWTFFTFIICYFPLFLAFGICFYTMFRYSGSEEDEFFTVSFGMSMLKTFIMFAGEFEASNIPFGTANVTSHIVFTVFVFVISIVLLNLLNGLAVSDAQTIRKDAEILSLCARIRLIYYIEKMTYNTTKYLSILEKMTNKKLTIFPNRKSGKIEVNGTTFKNRNIDEDIMQQAISIAQRNKSDISDSNAGGNQGDTQKKLSDIEKHQEVINKKINEITKELDFLHKTSIDSNMKLNEVLTIIKTFGLHSSTK